MQVAEDAGKAAKRSDPRALVNAVQDFQLVEEVGADEASGGRKHPAAAEAAERTEHWGGIAPCSWPFLLRRAHPHLRTRFPSCSFPCLGTARLSSRERAFVRHPACSPSEFFARVKSLGRSVGNPFGWGISLPERRRDGSIPCFISASSQSVP